MKKIVSLFIFTALFSIAAFADVRLPDNPKPTPTAMPETIEKDAELLIQVTDQVAEPTLLINKSVMAQFAMNAAETEKVGIGSTQTIVGGVFLSLAFVFGGVLFARGKEKMPKAAVSALIMSIIGFAGTIAYANIAPPRNISINKNLFSKELQGYAMAKGNVKVRITDNKWESGIRLLIPRESAKSSKQGE